MGGRCEGRRLTARQEEGWLGKGFCKAEDERISAQGRPRPEGEKGGLGWRGLEPGKERFGRVCSRQGNKKGRPSLNADRSLSSLVFWRESNKTLLGVVTHTCREFTPRGESLSLALGAGAAYEIWFDSECLSKRSALSFSV